MLARLALLALALFTATATPAVAQTWYFSSGDGFVTGSPLLNIDWNGRPAFLVINRGDTFINMGCPSWPKPDGISFKVEAVFAQDLRPCAVGSKVGLNQADNFMRGDLGYIGKDGTLTNLSPRNGYERYTEPGAERTPIVLSLFSSRPYDTQPYMVNYCEGGGGCWTTCPGTGGAPTPEFIAIVLVPSALGQR